MKYRRTKTVTETSLLLVKTKKEGARLPRCGECADSTLWLEPALAANLLGMSVSRIYRLIETEAVHFTETSNGEFKVCSRSLIEILNK
jgi:hypothetical protein